jgi:hypothetical protein
MPFESWAIRGLGPAALGRILQVSRKREFERRRAFVPPPYGDVRRFCPFEIFGRIEEIFAA